MTTIVYLNDGEDFLGEFPDKRVSEWKLFGRGRVEAKSQWMYKGYHYGGLGKVNVVVFSSQDRSWTNGEKARRKANGLLGIKEYYIGD